MDTPARSSPSHPDHLMHCAAMVMAHNAIRKRLDEVVAALDFVIKQVSQTIV